MALSSFCFALFLHGFIAVASSSMRNTAGFCPSDFTRIHDSCYSFSTEVTMDWDEAFGKCQQLDPLATLINIETAEEWNDVKTYMQENELAGKYWFIGGTDREVTGKWTWEGSRTPFGFTAWCPRQPDNRGGVEHCTNLEAHSLCWNDLHCSHNFGGGSLNFICERAATFCPPDFTQIQEGCYNFSTEVTMDWDEAYRKCEQLNSRARLVNIETETEWSSIKSYMQENELAGKYWFIGGSDRVQQGKWTWMGSEEPFGFTAWCRGQPDNRGGVEHCANLEAPTLCWNDLHCSHNFGGGSLYFICEYA